MTQVRVADSRAVLQQERSDQLTLEPKAAAAPVAPSAQARWNAWDLVALILCLLPVLVWLGLPQPLGNGLPQWDQSGYFRQGYELYLRLRQMDATGLLESCRLMGFYPPGYSLLLGGWFLLVGPTFWAARLLTVILFSLSAWLVYGMGARHASRSTGLLAMLLLLSSPLYASMGTDILMEMPGAVLALLFTWLYFLAGAGRDSWSPGRFLAAGPVLTLCLLTKYNLPVLLLAGMALYEAASLLPLLRDRQWRAARRRLCIDVLFVAVWVALPLVAWAWFVGPVGRRAMTDFLTSVPTAEYPRSDYRFYLYYPQILGCYFVHPVVQAASLLGAGASLLCYRRLAPVLRWCCLSAAATLVIMTLNMNHQGRFIFIALPFLWLLSARAAAIAMRWTWTRLDRRARPAAAVAAMGAGCLLAISLPFHMLTALRWQDLYSTQIAQAMQFIGRCTAQDPDRGISFACTFNEISQHLLRLQKQMRQTQVLPLAQPDFWLDRRYEELPQDPPQMLALWIANRPVGQQLITFEVLPDSPLYNEDYTRWNASRLWLLPLLEACPAIEHVGQFVTDSKIRIHAWTLHKPPQG